VVTYVETNFLMGMATGRDAAADALLAALPPLHVLAIPSVCFMEAFSAFEDERGRRNVFKDQLEIQIHQLKRDITSAHARLLLSHLEQARIENGLLLNDVRARLLEATSRISARMEMIPLTPTILQESVTSLLLSDPTDNLILTCILEHARQSSDTTTKSFLSSNFRDFDVPEVRSTLAQVGVTKYFRSTEKVLEWLNSGQT
jgi:hypothetical protein